MSILKTWGVKRIKILSTIASLSGLKELHNQHPDVDVIVGAIDDALSGVCTILRYKNIIRSVFDRMAKLFLGLVTLEIGNSRRSLHYLGKERVLINSELTDTLRQTFIT